MEREKKTEVVFQILAGEQQILQRTDQKAATLLSILGVFAVFFIVHYMKIEANTFNFIFIFLYFLSAFASILYLMAVLSPRIKGTEFDAGDSGKTALPTFFGGIVKYKSPAEYAHALDKLLDKHENAFEAFAETVYSISMINSYKNKHIRMGILFFVLAITFELIIILSLHVSKMQNSL